MTLVRRELPPSRSASRPDRKTGRRIADTRTLQSCPHRASANATQEIQPTFLSLARAGGGTLRDVRARFPARHGGPQEAHQLAGNRGHGDRRAFAVADEMAVAPMQPLLRPPRLPDDLSGLSPGCGLPARGRPGGDGDSARRPRPGPGARAYCRLSSAHPAGGSRRRSTRSAPAPGRP